MSKTETHSNMNAVSNEKCGLRLAYFYNGNIITMNPSVPRSRHMMLMGDRIYSCDSGTSPLGLDFRDAGFDSVRRRFGSELECIDLKGRTVIPGLIDSHVHFLWWGLNQTQADLNPARSEAQAVEILRRHSARAQPGQWISGFGWSHNTWESQELPSRASIDAAFPDNPVFLSSKCGHLAWVNSAALSAAKLDTSTPDPEGGEIERKKADGKNRLTGILKETAIGMVESCIAAPTEEAMRRALKEGTALAHSLGLTGMQTPEDLGTWSFLQRAHGENALHMRINFWIPVAVLDCLEKLRIRNGLGDEWLRIGAVKLFTDGSLGGRTALMYDPYENEPDNFGICVTEKEELTQRTLQANRAGLPMAVHAIGDRAVDYVLSAFEAAQADLGTNEQFHSIRNRIEHLQVFSPRDLERLKKTRPVASMQPVHLCADMRPADKFWGSRSRYAYGCRTLADAGCLLAFGSDAPVEPINPFYGIYAAVTRRNLEGEPKEGWYPQEKISVEETLAAYTINPMIASGQQADLGSLSPGKLADFVVLDEDPTQIPPGNLKNLTPVATYVGAKCMCARADWA